MSMKLIASDFFEACEAGKGWKVCQAWCHPNATFSCQSDALAEVSTLEGYTNWMRDLLGPIPDGRYELKSFAVDDDRRNVAAFGVFCGTNTGPGPVPPTGNQLAADYVYVMEFDGDKIRHMTKIWNDGHSMRQLGWG